MIPRFLVHYRLAIGMVTTFLVAFLIASCEKPRVERPLPPLDGLIEIPAPVVLPAEGARRDVKPSPIKPAK